MLRRLLYIFPLLTLLFSSVLAFWQPKIASAAGTFIYADSTYKTISGPETTDSSDDAIISYSLQSNNKDYKGSGQGGLCTGKITVTTPGAQTGTFNGSCAGIDVRNQQISISTPGGSGTNGAISGAWITHSEIVATINSNATIFTDSKIDNDLTYTSQSTDSCTGKDKIHDFKFANGSGAHASDPDTAKGSATIDLYSVPGGGNDNCVKTTAKITFTDPGNYKYYFSWQDSGTISTSDTTGMIFCNSEAGDDCGPDKKTFYDDGTGSNGNDNCKTQLTAGPGATTGQLVIRADDGNPFGDGWPSSISGADLSGDGQGCNVSKSIPVLIADPIQPDGKKASQLDAGSSVVAQKSDSADSNNNTLGCDYQLTNPLTWIICPLVQMLVRFAGAADKIITAQLTVNTAQIFCNDAKTAADKGSCSSYYAAWQSFRNISLGILVIGGLIMLISQVLGFEFLDAYTIRKVLPRLFAGVIGISLSWPLMQFFVTVSNDLGIGIRQLIYTPFDHIGGNTFSLNLGHFGVESIFGTLGLAGVVPAWIEFGGPVALISYALTAAGAVLVGVLVLILRQVALTLMIILAPIAIISYILPNTQKLYNLWWQSFSKALLMFPMIAAMIASGRVFSAIANLNAHTQANQSAVAGGGTINGLFYGTAAVAAYFIPYFLIPKTFSMSGAAMGAIGGAVTSRAKGFFEGQRKGRAEYRQKRHKLARGRGLYRSVINIPTMGLRQQGGKGLFRARGEVGANGKKQRRFSFSQTDAAGNRSLKGLRETAMEDDGAGGQRPVMVNGKEKKTWKKKNIADTLNRQGFRVIDAPDYWRQVIGGNEWQHDTGRSTGGRTRRGLGKAGRFVFGRQAENLADRKAMARIQHTAKAGEEVQTRYPASRVMSGDLQYHDGAFGDDPNNRVQTGRYAGMRAQDAFDAHFGMTDDQGRQQYYDHETGDYTHEATDKDGNQRNKVYRAPQGEADMLDAAAILDRGGDTQREAAKDLRAYAHTMDTMHEHEETHRFDSKFLGKMQAAQAGRLENHEIAQYYTDCLKSGLEPFEASMRVKHLTRLAEGKRPSQSDGYGLEWKVTTDEHGRTYEIPVDTYADPLSSRAQARVSSLGQDGMRGMKGEDLMPDPKDTGRLSGFGEAWVAQLSPYEMETVVKEGRKVVQPKTNADGSYIPKKGAAADQAAGARASFQSSEYYASADPGVQAGVKEIMRRAGVPSIPKAAGTAEEAAEAAARQQAANAPQQPQQQQDLGMHDDLGGRPQPLL